MDEQRIRLSFPATLSGFEQGFCGLRRALEGGSLGQAARYNAELVFEEIVANIVRHGASQGEQLGIEVSLEVGRDSIVITFDDDGVPFDPCGRTDPKLPSSLADAPDGGLGLMLVRRAASDMQYQRTPEHRNRLVVTLPATPGAARNSANRNM
jgi:serine/threonine-protein kinase RsbW